jgi:hypothetical protein
MRKIFSLLAAVLFAGSMMAADVVKATLDFTSNTAWNLPVGSGDGITTDSAYSDGTYTIRLAATTKYYFNTDGYLMLGKANSTLTLPAFDFDVTKIVVTGRAGASTSTKQNIFVGENAVSTETTGATNANAYAIAAGYQAAGNVYVLKVTSAHNTQVTKIEIYGEGEGGDVTPPTPVENPVNLGEKTIAEFLTLKNVKDTCILTGVVDSIKNTTYGNLYLSDATGQVYVYGVLNAAGESKKFADLNVEAGDTLTIKAIYSEHNNAPQVKNGIFVSVKKAQGETPELEAIVYNWAKDAASGHVGTTILGGNSNISIGTIKIHENTDDVDGIKFGSSYVYADGKWVAIKPVEGGFKAGDEIRVSVVFNNSDLTKYCMVDLRAADGDTRIWMSDSLSTLNGRNAGEPVVQTYTLAADQDSLFLGRYGNTGMFITFLQVARSGEVVPPTPVTDPTNCAEAAAAALSVSANNELYNDGTEYTIEGYVTSIAYAWKAGSMTFWMADTQDGGNVLEAYKCAVDSANAPKVTDKVRVTGKLTKYGSTPEFAEGCTVVIVEVGPGQQEQDIEVTNCATAAQAALSVSANNEPYKNGQDFTVTGYVTAIQNAWANGVMTFWMADTQDGGKVLEAYKCAIANQTDAPNIGYKVSVTGKLTKYNTTAEFAEGCTCAILERAEDPINLGEKSIAEFLALKNTKDTCILTGVIANLPEDKTSNAWKYGNFDLVDGNDTLYIYGLLTPDGQKQQFASMGLENGSEITILAVYTEYNGKPQAANAILVPGEISFDTLNVADAYAAAQALEQNTESPIIGILGYVAKIKTEYSEKFGNISFYMTDDKTSEFGDLQVYRGKISKEEGEALAHGDLVLVVGKLKHTFKDNNDYYEVAEGSSVSVLSKQAIENIVLTEKVNKVLMDGVIYIVRDGKLYNLQGAQVR